MNELQEKIKARFQAAKRILITTHIRPDGDAIGSSLALGLALGDIGKQVQVVLSDGVPDDLKHLPGADKVLTQAEGEFDLIVSVDCSELRRVGNALDGYRPPDLVIDHHLTNQPFGTLNLVDPQAAATASVLARHFSEWGLVITKPIAANLLTGLVTDTIGFRTPSTTPEVLRQAADLIERGAELSMLYFHSLVQQTFPAVKYWGAGLANLQREDGILWSTLTVADREISGYTGNDDADLINVISSIDEADVAVVFVEQSKDKTKISWRGLKPHVDVSQIARQFGGGGHKAAAGAEVTGSLDEVRKRALAATRKSLNQS